MMHYINFDLLNLENLFKPNLGSIGVVVLEIFKELAENLT